MKLRAKHIVIGAGVVLIAGAALQAAKTAGKLVATPLFKAPRLPDFQRIVFPLEVQIKNPTAGSLKFNFPFVELMIGETLIGSSEARHEVVRIKAHSQTMLRDIAIEVPLLNLGSFAGPLLDFVRQKRHSVDLKVRISSQADLGLSTIPVNITQPITISRNGGNL